MLHIANWNRVAAGTTVIREGEPGTAFYVLASGEVQVMRNDRMLTMLKAGECFGEMAYLRRRSFKRSASIRASTEVILIEIRAEALEAASESCRHSSPRHLELR